MSLVLVSLLAGCGGPKNGTQANSNNTNPASNQTSIMQEKQIVNNVVQDNKDLLGSISDKINPSLPQYLFKIYGQKEEGIYIINKIKISRNDNNSLIQEILVSQARTWDSEKFGVYIEDINFDGYKDIRVQADTPAGANVPYYYWLWDNNKSKYIQNKDLEVVTSPTINPVNKEIVSNNRGSAAEYTQSEYKFINEKLTLIKEIEQVADPDKNVWHITVKELVGNEMKVTKTYDETLKSN